MDDAFDDEEVPELLDTSSAPEVTPRQLDRPKVPITLLTGYLGAGKSTLLEYVLTADHGYRIAVCMNDFGDSTDIEAKSLTLSDPTTQTQTTSMLSLPNGCLCCSFKDMGIAAIEDMVASQEGVNWVLVELTGVADPGPIARSFWSNEEMGDLTLDGVVCVVDCRNVLKQLSDKPESGTTNECQRQVACADVVLLNKIDLVDEDRVREVEQRIKQINPTLRIHRTERSRIPLDSLFNLRAYADSSDVLNTTAEVAATRPQEPKAGQHPGHDHDHDDHDHGSGDEPRHDAQIATALIPLPALTPEQYTSLNRFLESLLWEGKVPTGPEGEVHQRMEHEKSPEILRAKGYIPLTDGRAFILQGVTDIFELKEIPGGETETEATSGSSERNGKLVFIGRNVDDGLKEAVLRYLGLQT